VVPTAYLELTATAARPSSIYSNSGSSMAGSVNTTGKKQGPAVAPRRGAKKLKYVEALYEYTAQSDVEWSMAEGERFVVVKEDPGDGWTEVEKGGVTKSVPTNYVQVV
jgi:formin-binding protein 1